MAKPDKKGRKEESREQHKSCLTITGEICKDPVWVDSQAGGFVKLNVALFPKSRSKNIAYFNMIIRDKLDPEVAMFVYSNFQKGDLITIMNATHEPFVYQGRHYINWWSREVAAPEGLNYISDELDPDDVPY